MTTKKNHQELDFCKLKVAESLYEMINDIADEQVEGVSVSDIYKMLSRPPETKLGDFAFPCFKFAKALKKAPPAVSAALAGRIDEVENPWIKAAQNVGPFLNISVNTLTLADYLISSVADNSYFSRIESWNEKSDEKVMIEYSQPNTHKSFHVGHMRNVALGDSIGRLYKYCGHPTTMVNYIGDEGAHIAKCLWYIQKNNLSPAEDADKGEWLGEMYAAASLKISDASEEEGKEIYTEVSKVLSEIEAKSGASYDLWLKTRPWSLDDFREIYEWTSADFDHWFYESEVSEESQEIVDEYLKKDVFIEDDGAIGIDLKDKKAGFLILRKRDGNTLYATKDLALARRKFDEYSIDRSIYVVASEQNLHFKQVFLTLEAMGFEKASKCYHLSYGMVTLPDGKMSSRKGNVIVFNELRNRLSTELDKPLSKYKDEWSEEEINSVKHKLSVGSIRYGMLCSDPVKDIVFDFKNWTSFEGNTGPYLMYSYARTKSILRKGTEAALKPRMTPEANFETLEERELLNYINDFNNMVWQSTQTYKPSTLCHFLFDMCKAYNRMLSNVSVLKAETTELKEARLALVEAFSNVLFKGLSLLGITPPERM